MARLCWMVVALGVFLSDSVAAQEQEEGIKNQNDLGNTVSPAVKIPQVQDTEDLQQVSTGDHEGQVSQGGGTGGEEGTALSTGTGKEMGEDIGKGGKGGKVKCKGGGKCKKGGKGKRKRGGKRRKGGKGKRKRGGKRRKGGKGKRKRGGKRRKGGKRRGIRSAEEQRYE
ncbi:rRNA/tRNA 2'-O-methyltransferase fibrillarin-like protein 1 [Etheostoma cragini]|uniref:rRNA/tRNA 2'-O-methyltransferase fibrillarin-like protein 1 n=1 Tax=Etheostoma cragini TaxID=417921 RepID=UPI00155EF0AC|nr:rRNA/tRNA 2'-O-methyltransferase fibrillarin-like protein 1 [Etheostoma cragini]